MNLLASNLSEHKLFEITQVIPFKVNPFEGNVVNNVERYGLVRYSQGSFLTACRKLPNDSFTASWIVFQRQATAGTRKTVSAKDPFLRH